MNSNDHKMTSRQAAEAMFEAEVRTETLIYIPGVIGGDYSFPAAFEDEFAENLPNDETAQIYSAIPALARFREAGGRYLAEDMAETLRFAPGFLIEAATPSRKYHGGGSYTAGWGSYYTEWLYAPDEASIGPACVAWAEAMHAKDAGKTKAGS